MPIIILLLACAGYSLNESPGLAIIMTLIADLLVFEICVFMVKTYPAMPSAGLASIGAAAFIISFSTVLCVVYTLVHKTTEMKATELKMEMVWADTPAPILDEFKPANPVASVAGTLKGMRRRLVRVRIAHRRGRHVATV